MEIKINKYWWCLLWPFLGMYMIYKGIAGKIAKTDKDEFAFGGFVIGVIGALICGFWCLITFTVLPILFCWAFGVLGAYSLWWHFDFGENYLED